WQTLTVALFDIKTADGCLFHWV
ncbi:hypothetical protein DBR06_SOUSAS2810186, partial [Sousa chinensis]